MLVLGCPTRRFYVWGFWSGAMPKGLKRYYGRGHLHFLTFSCYRRLPGAAAVFRVRVLTFF
jgi:hypothetical protein